MTRQIDMTRREFLKGALAALGFGALGGYGKVFAAAHGALSGGKPNLTLGMISDIHIRMNRAKDGGFSFRGEDVLRQVLRHFRENGVDAVTISGDLADRGLVEEIEAIGRVWREVFPDGSGVEKLIIMGNHDWEGWKYNNNGRQIFGKGYYEHTIRNDPAAAWKKAFGEDFSPVWRKEVKGYTFVGAHWMRETKNDHKDVIAVSQGAEWIAANGDTIDRTRPFFYLQHPHPKDTCHGWWIWGRDDGSATAALSRFPNAIALSGHSHATINDERALWQGAFTSIGCGSLIFTSKEYGEAGSLGRENGIPAHDADWSEVPYRIMRDIDTNTGRQGMIARIYGDRIVIERIDFENMASLGEDWVLPLPAGGTRSSASARAAEIAPEFPAGAALAGRLAKGKNRGGGKVKSVEQRILEVEIPAANRPGAGRVFDYALEIEGSNGKRDERYCLAEGFHRSATSERARRKTVFRIGLGRLAATGELAVRVAPRNSYGKRGMVLQCVVQA